MYNPQNTSPGIVPTMHATSKSSSLLPVSLTDSCILHCLVTEHTLTTPLAGDMFLQHDCHTHPSNSMENGLSESRTGIPKSLHPNQSYTMDSSHCCTIAKHSLIWQYWYGSIETSGGVARGLHIAWNGTTVFHCLYSWAWPCIPCKPHPVVPPASNSLKSITQNKKLSEEPE